MTTREPGVSADERPTKRFKADNDLQLDYSCDRFTVKVTKGRGRNSLEKIINSINNNNSTVWYNMKFSAIEEFGQKVPQLYHIVLETPQSKGSLEQIFDFAAQLAEQFKEDIEFIEPTLVVTSALDFEANETKTNVTTEGLVAYLKDWFRDKLGFQSEAEKIANTTASEEWALNMIGLTKYRETLRNRKDGRQKPVCVAHPDTGYLDHSDILDKIDGPQNFYDPHKGDASRPGYAHDKASHGLATASIIVGNKYGVAPDAKIVPMRTNNGVVYLCWSSLEKAFNHAIHIGADVISMSLGGLSIKSYALMELIDTAIDKGIIVLAAAGNYTDSWITFPANYEPVIAVAACGPDSKLWPNSARGSKVDVTAPGFGVYRATFEGDKEAYLPSAGTSYAVAHVAGIAALWVKYIGHTFHGRARQQAFKQLIGSSLCCNPVIGAKKNTFGGGIINVAKLFKANIDYLERAAPQEQTEDTTALREQTDLMMLPHSHEKDINEIREHLQENCKQIPAVGYVRELQVGYSVLLDPEVRKTVDTFYGAKTMTPESVGRSPLTAKTLREFLVNQQKVPAKLRKDLI